jgi:hypothetical protein
MALAMQPPMLVIPQSGSALSSPLPDAVDLVVGDDAVVCGMQPSPLQGVVVVGGADGVQGMGLREQSGDVGRPVGTGSGAPDRDGFVVAAGK